MNLRRRVYRYQIVAPPGTQYRCSQHRAYMRTSKLAPSLKHLTLRLMPMIACKHQQKRTIQILLCSLLTIPTIAQALETQVLSNFNQPASGAVLRIGVSDVEATPFITDSSFSEFDAVELTAVTLFGTGLFFVEIWDVDAFAQPNNPVAVLQGPSAPSGFSRYVSNSPGPVSLQPNTSYFLVYGLRNGGSQVQVDTIDFNGADTVPTPIYQFGTDIDNDGIADLVNRCRGTRANDYVSISWDCGQPIAPRYFSKLRFLAEEPTPPTNFSLTANPLSVDFGLVTAGNSSTPILVTLLNDGTEDQTLEQLVAGPNFALSNDTCSNNPLASALTCTFEVTFTPSHGGFTTGTVTIPATSDPRSPYGLPLVGESDELVIVIPPGTNPARPSAVPISPWVAWLAGLGILVIFITYSRKGSNVMNHPHPRR
jgi:Cep192 domain 4